MPTPNPIPLSRFAGGPHGRRLRPAGPTSSAIRLPWAALLVVPGLAALVVDPALWLGRTWLDPAYQSDGAIAAGIVLALLVASVASGSPAPDARDRRRAWVALAVTAAVRLAGRVLAVNTIGALALVVDVWALATLLGVSRRPFALHPAPLALLFALSLPVEHLAQRILGHPLQLLAAGVSEWLLSPFFPELVREGVLLVHPALELAVDLPCSGARGLVLLSALALGLASRRVVGARGALLWIGAVGVGALAANALRIIALFVGGVHGVPIIEEPWHGLLGAGVLALGASPLLHVASRARARRPARPPLSLAANAAAARLRRLPWPAALAFSAAAMAIACLPARPIDVGPRIESLRLPTTLGRFDGVDVPLSVGEAQYYTRWGGFAQKRVYGDDRGDAMTALLVRTRSPLRHLHGPDVCLRGAGHDVTRLGVLPGAVPVVLYKSVAPDGRAWRVEASFVSDHGVTATSVSEVVWRWLESPGATWSLIERITPWNTCESAPGRCRAFEAALLASLDLPAPSARLESQR